MDATMWHRDQTNCRRCLLILNGLRVLMEWAWLFCTSVSVCLMYLLVWLFATRDSGDHTLFFGHKRSPLCMRILLSPFRPSLGFDHTTAFFWLGFFLFCFCSSPAVLFLALKIILSPSCSFFLVLKKLIFEMCMALISSLRLANLRHSSINKYPFMRWSELSVVGSSMRGCFLC